MLNLKGQNLKETLNLIGLDSGSDERKEAIKNATHIISSVIKVYEEKIKSGEVGKNGTGPSGNVVVNPRSLATGLVYGRIQSGKTRAMTTSAALAFDNKFQIVVVLTSNNNRLVEQTQNDFRNNLPGSIRVYSKSHFKQEVGQAKQILSSGQGGILIVCSKGTSRLNQMIDFLQNINAKDYCAMIFDDEGDQATLDTNTLIRSTRDPLIPASRTHQLIHDPDIHSLRISLPRHVFVSVTGTPSGIVLQNIDSQSRPSFIELLKPGSGYVGGNFFFEDPTPQNNQLISLINEDERISLLNSSNNSLPQGLKDAIRFFLISAASAGIQLGWPRDGYKFLCHPSVRNADQEKVKKLIIDYLNELSGAFINKDHYLYNDLYSSYKTLKRQNSSIPSFSILLKIIRLNFNSREVLLLNKSTTGNELNYSRNFNFLIGGNTLGRGLAIKNLLVTYYVRESKVAQMDTMYQHARMFGYRKSTLPYTKVFLPPKLYERFRNIYISDEDLRQFIEDNKDRINSFPIMIAKDIRATRNNILDARKIDILIPGKQIYPNYPSFNNDDAINSKKKTLKKLKLLFPEYKKEGKIGKIISTEDTCKLVNLIKTNGSNIWNDSKMTTIISYIKQHFNDGVVLKYRIANRRPGDINGLLAQGVLSGTEVFTDSSGDKPVLWIVKTKFKDNQYGLSANFIYPTLVIPKTFPLVVFNKS